MPGRSVYVRVDVRNADKAISELNKLGIKGTKAIDRVGAASTRTSKKLKFMDRSAGSARRTMQGLGNSVALIEGPLGGLASRASVLGSALGRLGIGGALVLGTLTALTAGFLASSSAAAQAERSIFRVGAVLKSTGYSAGVTRREVEEFSQGLAADTLASVKAVREATAVMLTFRKVTGETFFEAVSLSQDMASVLGTDVKAAALQLGKALQDPILGITALSRAGVTFSQSQRDMIRDLVEGGQIIEAQGIILEEFRKQFEGAGKAEAGGISGAADTLGQQWGELLAEIGRTEGVAGGSSRAMRGLAGVLEDIRLGLGLAGHTETTAVPLVEQIKLVEEELKRLKNVKTGLFRASKIFNEADIAQAERTLVGLREKLDEEKIEKDKALAGQEQANAAANVEQLLKIESDFNKRFLALRENKVEKITALAEKEIKQLEGLRTEDNGARIDALIKRRGALRDKEIDQANAGARKRAEAAVAAAERIVLANDKVITSLEDELVALGQTDRQRFIDTAMRRLSAEATDEQSEAMRIFAGLLYDGKEARKEQLDAERDALKLLEDIKTPADEYADELDRINFLLDKNAIGETDAARARSLAAESYREAAAEASAYGYLVEDVAASIGHFAGDAVRDIGSIGDAWRNLQETILDILTETLIEKPVEDWINSILRPADPVTGDKGGGLTSFVSSLFSGFGGGDEDEATDQLAKDWAEEFGSSAADAVGDEKGGLFSTLGGAFKGLFSKIFSGGGFFSDLFSGFGTMFKGLFSKGGGILDSILNFVPMFFHDGGLVGASAGSAGRAVPMAAFAGAPRLHGGNMPGLRPDEYAAILQDGEGVISRRDMQAASGRGRKREELNVSLHVYGATNPNEWQDGEGLIMSNLRSVIQRAERDA